MSKETQNNTPVSVEPVVTLNGAQLLQALDFIAPDRDTDPQQLECELTISFADGPAGSGYYCYCTDYPDEGAIMLDAEAPAAPVAAPAPAFSVGVHGVGIIDDNPSALAVYFNAAPNDDDIRALHEIVTNAPVAAQVQPDAVRNKYDWVQGPYVTDTMGSGWCVRIDGTDIFADLNQYGCKGRVTFQIARGLSSKEEAEATLTKWLRSKSAPVAAQVQPSGDRAMLESLMRSFDMEAWNCPNCTATEETKDCDSAIMLREYLANNPVPAQAQQPVSGADGLPIELQGVSETAAEGGGMWRSCSGCHELNEGHDTGPRSKVFGCALGNGCSECGGIGAIWDTTDYDAMADFMAAESQQRTENTEPVGQDQFRDAAQMIEPSGNASRNAVLEEAAQELMRRRALLSGQNVALNIQDGLAMYDICIDAIRNLMTGDAQPSRNAGELADYPTRGMNLGQRIAHVGGRENAQGYVEFGSPMAVHALIQHVLRDFHRQGRVNLTPAKQTTDPLQGAADWLVRDCGVSDPTGLANRLGIGYNRASRLVDAARKEQA